MAKGRNNSSWRNAGALALLCLFPMARAAEAPGEYDVKATYLLNFAKFVEWPANAFATADSPIAICILGKDPFGRAIDELVQGESANGRKLVVRRMPEFPSPQTCQIVFSEDGGAELARMGAAGRAILTVGEGAAFVRNGGMIGFVVENHRVRFDISQSAARAASLHLSSRLLAVAREVAR